MINKILIKAGDKYIKRPLFWDIVICALIISVCYYILEYKKYFTLDVDVESLKSNLSDIISTSISLAGFVLASLTIIVTFKDNISQKQQAPVPSTKQKDIPATNETTTGIALLFTSKHYKRIVGVFTWASFILLFIFLLFSGIKTFTKILSTHFIFYSTIIGITLIALTIFRSLIVLCQIIKLQIDK